MDHPVYRPDGNFGFLRNILDPDSFYRFDSAEILTFYFKKIDLQQS